MDISKILDLIKDPDLKIKISDLVSENLSLKEENFKLKRKLESIENKIAIEKNLLIEGNLYFMNKENKKDGPFCTKCWDSDKKLVRLHLSDVDQGISHFNCPNCKLWTTNRKF